MKKLLLIFLLYVLSHSTQYTSETAEQIAVQTCIDSVAPGDTVNVPAGTVTYTIGDGKACYLSAVAGLCIERGITLIGDSTHIIFGAGFTRGGVQITPSAESIAANEKYDISGFIFDGDSGSMGNEGIIGIHASYTTAMDSLMIHNNTFMSCISKAIVDNGAMFGVIYSNIFVDVNYAVTGFGGDYRGWNNFSQSRGTSENLFFEDNVVSTTYDMSGFGGTDHGQGFVGMVFRYNTYDNSNSAGGQWFTIHGLQSMAIVDGFTCPSGCGYVTCEPTNVGSCDELVAACTQWSTMKSEYYGNILVNGTNLNNYMITRGGWLMMFNNYMEATGTDPKITYNQYSCNTCQSPDSSYDQQVKSTYVFNNYNNKINIPMEFGLDFCADFSNGDGDTITENVNYWNHTYSFDGTSGIGSGDTMPTCDCDSGVGYWQTSYAYPDSVSDNLDTIKKYSQAGTFWTCQGTNNWVSDYTPYTYPHPLRGSEVAPVIKQAIITIVR